MPQQKGMKRAAKVLKRKRKLKEKEREANAKRLARTPAEEHAGHDHEHAGHAH